MNETDCHLNLVFNETGDDPLVLEGWWSGAVNRERPNFSNLGLAEPRLRALCILFLLAKYRETQYEPPSDELIFQVDIKKRTWICTLGNDAASVRKWVKKRFFIHEKDLFVFPSPGATHNKHGKKTPSVTFKLEPLPLSNLHLFFNKIGAPRDQLRLLHSDELIPFACKIEKKHWKISAIEKLFSDASEKKISAGKSQTKDPANDALLLASSADALKTEPVTDPMQWRSHLGLLYGTLMEKEFDQYREKCKPFFAYVGNSLDAAKLPYLWRKPVWNGQQGKLLYENCIHYAQKVSEGVTKLSESGGHFNDATFTKSIWKDIFVKRNLMEATKTLFHPLLPRGYYRSAFNLTTKTWTTIRDCFELLPEAQAATDILSWGLENSNRNITVGVYFAHQIAWIDFLKEVCLPFYIVSPIEFPGPRVLYRNILLLKKEVARNGDLFQRFCNDRRDFNEAIEAARELLKAQTSFFTAFHARLVTLEKSQYTNY